MAWRHRRSLARRPLLFHQDMPAQAQRQRVGGSRDSPRDPIARLFSPNTRLVPKHLPYQPTTPELRRIWRTGRERIGKNSVGIGIIPGLGWCESASSPNLPRMTSAHVLLVPWAGSCLLHRNNFCSQSPQLRARGEQVRRRSSSSGSMGVNE